MADRPYCTGTNRHGDPCRNRARPGTNPPRCGRHVEPEANTIRHQKEARQHAFLIAYRDVGNIRDAAQVAGIDRSTHYAWLRDDLDYRQRFATAESDAADLLEREARRRAVVGVEEAVYYKGQQVGAVRKYSDVLLIFLLKGLRPEKYRERYQHEHSGPGGGAIPVDVRATQLAEKLREIQQGNGHAPAQVNGADAGH